MLSFHLAPFVLVYVRACLCEPGGELQTSSGTLDEGPDEDADWEEEREAERAACEGDDFIPPKIMVRILATINFKIDFEVEQSAYLRQFLHI